MNTRSFYLAASLLLSVGNGAMAQTAVSPGAHQAMVSSIPSSAVGRWLYDSQGNVIGSVRSLTDDGATAVIMVGSYFQPGSHEARIPSSMLSVTGGKLTLRPASIEALNIAARH